MAKKKSKEIPAVINTDCFMWWVSFYAQQFKTNQGYGRWLVEYQRMEANGWFKPEKLRQLYIKHIDGPSPSLTYIYWDAVNSICSQAIAKAEAFLAVQKYEIRLITGVIAADDNDRDLVDLTLNYALKTCKAMNEEAEEDLFRVYDSKTKRPINKKYYNYPTF